MIWTIEQDLRDRCGESIWDCRQLESGRLGQSEVDSYPPTFSNVQFVSSGQPAPLQYLPKIWLNEVFNLASYLCFDALFARLQLVPFLLYDSIYPLIVKQILIIAVFVLNSLAVTFDDGF